MSSNPDDIFTSPVNEDVCNALLGQTTALAAQAENPVPPYPIFFPNPDCLGTYSAFPNYFTGVDCTPPLTPQNNCLKVVSGADKDPANPDTVYTAADANAIEDMLSSQLLFSAWSPPNYTLVYLPSAPDGTKKISELTVYMQYPNQPVANFCRQKKMLQMGKSLTGQIPFFNVTKNDELSCDPQVATDLNMNVTQVIVYKHMDFNEILIRTCMGLNVDFGAGPNNSFSEFWDPKKGCTNNILNNCPCDKLMIGFCSQANVADILKNKPDLVDVCRCFQEQLMLDLIYQPFGVEVPVLCFGGNGPEQDITRACAYNTGAYKTQSMINPVQGQACSFAECEAVAQTLLQQTGEVITCHGKFVQFPALPSVVSAVSPIPFVSTIIQKTSIPSWIWYIFGAGVACLVLFIFSLSFVT